MRAVASTPLKGNAEKVAVPWRDLGRTDLTPSLLTRRLEDYLLALLD